MKKNSFRIDCRHLFGWMTCAMLTATIVACSDDPGLNGNTGGEIESGWIEGNIDPNQSWATAVSVQLDIETDHEADVTAQTILNQNVTILGQKHIKESNVMFVDVPQGIGTSFGLVYDDGSDVKQYKRIDISGKPSEVIDVDFRSGAVGSSNRAATRAATNQSLYGNAYITDCGYINFGPWAWSDVQKSLEESVNSSMNMKTLIDYEIKTGDLVQGGELVANDDIILSFLYGYTGQTGSRILGYYYHSPESYADIEFVDISEALSLDYFNNKAKVQYQLDNQPTWYDANFDYKDDPKNPAQTPASSSRKGDDAWNTLNVLNYYGDRVTAIRGLSFKLSIPKGKEFGFYLRENSLLNTAQKNILSKIGVPDNKMPKYLANYSCANMNTGNYSSTENKKFRSAMAIYDNFTFMGMDDNMGGGDFDCNDVTFALSNSKGEKYIPEFTQATKESEMNQDVINEHPEYINPPSNSNSETELQSWTVAFENGGTDVDFDFNDVVIKVIPNTSNQTADLYLLAAGAISETVLYYNGTNLCEVHKAFNVDNNTMVNTSTNNATVEPVKISTINWSENTLEDNLAKFSLKVYDENGTLKRTVKYNERLSAKGYQNIPQAICVSGDWAWPMEYQSLSAVYPLLGNWATNIDNPEYFNWYAQPDNAKTVKPKNIQK